MKTRYALALVVVEQVLEEETEGGNGAWLNHEQREWRLVDDFETEKQALEESAKLIHKYLKTFRKYPLPTINLGGRNVVT